VRTLCIRLWLKHRSAVTIELQAPCSGERGFADADGQSRNESSRREVT
jgi:hypothetical protein